MKREALIKYEKYRQEYATGLDHLFPPERMVDNYLSTLPDEKENPYWYWPQCDVNRCKGVSSSGGVHWKETGYWSICDKHSAMCRAGKPQPKMRKSAIDENASRDPKTGYLPSKPKNK